MAAPIIVVPGSSSSATAGTLSRRGYRRAISREFQHHADLTVSSTAFAVADTTTLVYCTRLGSDGQPPSRLDGHYMLVLDGDVAAGEVRRILDGSFEGATASLRVDRPFSSALEAGTTIEVTSLLPGDMWMDTAGLNQVVGWALERLPIWMRLAFTGNGTRSHDLSAYDWLADEQLDHIEDRYGLAATDPTEVSPYGFSVQADGATRTLVTDLTYGDGQPFVVAAIGPASRLIRPASTGVWGAGNGLTADLDEAAAPLHWVRTWGTALALRYLIELTDEDETLTEAKRERRIARFRRRLDALGGVMAKIRRDELPRPSQRVRRPIQAALYDASPNLASVVGWP